MFIGVWSSLKNLDIKKHINSRKVTNKQTNKTPHSPTQKSRPELKSSRWQLAVEYLLCTRNAAKQFGYIFLLSIHNNPRHDDFSL